jgi:hypothetical protein
MPDIAIEIDKDLVDVRKESILSTVVQLDVA